ncbi:YJR141W-like protein [Saccharomyces cerevisiae x Saccharomyces kudriavzevii VIN7]|uniref:YJR141W-like protein n=1 Tax=Saccharomyces cerevisiae x Saccharomyces kudriavzevii (strain VIN7) TaxID=1095631 RepID=H0GX71_SACCK|nr:YJR141W-like protein [Saccharomyces cerevisiae x Saccharomyces kudriavzevii VIN7]
MVQYVVEWLPRINSVSVVVEGWKCIKVKSLKRTLLSISGDEGQEEDISLPAEAEEKVGIPYKFRDRGYDLEYIMKLRSKPPKKYDYSIMSLPDGKWTKEELRLDPDFSIECLHCKQQIIGKDNCQVLNNMPSEFWVELMDYWHCHKPDVEGEKSASYSKFETLKPSENEILIGNSFFQGTAATFKNVVLGEDDNVVSCKKCTAVLGQITADSLYKLYKWRLQLEHNGVAYRFPPEYDVVLSLINIVKGNSCRYALIKSRRQTLLVWIFSVDIGVTLTGNEELKRSMKLLYTDKAMVINQYLERQNVEEVDTQETTFTAFYACLQKVNALLPSNMKKMGEWSISYTSLT